MERCAYKIALEEYLIHLKLDKGEKAQPRVKAIVGFG